MANGKRGAPVGNTNGSKNKPWADALRIVATQDPKLLRKLAENTFAMAAAGDMQAVKEIGDRLDGKAHQTIAAEIVSEVEVILREPTPRAVKR